MNFSGVIQARQSVIQAVVDSLDAADGNEDRLIELTRARLENEPLVRSLSWRAVYSVMLDRLPDPQATRHFEKAGSYSAPAHICDVLRSAEFSSSCASFVLKALPEKEPIFFVHIPKTAGTSLKDAIRAQAACLPWDSMYYQEYWLRAAYGDLAHYSFLSSHWRARNEPLWVMGHYPLRNVLDAGLFRSGHRGFTVLRHPVEIIISQLNYMATCMRREPDRLDSSTWKQQIKSICPEFNENNPVIDGPISDKIVRADFFQSEYGNIISNYLGDAERSLSSVICNIGATGLDIVQTEELADYAQQSFGLTLPSEKSNVSEKFISRADLSPEAMIYIHETLMAKDIVFYDWARMTTNGKAARL